jgi:uncharacterized protein YceH (UPF0502 family)
MELTPEQVRVLGCLVEKEATTPDQYPLSTNGLTLACNQKNNRDPLVEYGDREVDQVMLDLRQAGLARTVHAAGARVPKHKHVLDEAWGLDARQLAVLAVLMLRGPNTLRELVARTERYTDIGGEDGARAVVRSLEERERPLVVDVGRGPGQRETRCTHLLEGEPAMGSGTTADAGSRPSHESSAPRPSALDARVGALEEEVGRLREHLARLEQELGIESDGG